MGGLNRVRCGFAVASMLLVAMSAAQTGGSVIREIVIRGNNFVTTDAIRSRMTTKEGQPYVQSQLDRDRDSIERLGFFRKVSVSPALIEGEAYKVTVDVEEFPVTKEIRILGNTVVPTEDLLKVITIAKDRPFNLDEQTSTGNEIAKLYADRGYFALVEQLAPLEDSPGTVSIVIREAKVNQVIVTGNVKTKDTILRRILKTRPGDVYNEPKWIRELQALLSTQWFEKVDYDRRQAENGYDIDLSVDLKEARTAQFIFGAAVDPRSSFAGSLGITDTNFRGSGQSIGVNFSQAIRGSGPSVDLSWKNPYMDSKDTSLDVSLYSRQLFRFTGNNFGTGSGLADNDFSERRTGLSVSASRPSGAYERYSAGVRYENIRTTDVQIEDQSQFIKQDGDLLLFGFGWLRNTRDYDLDPSRGAWMNLTVEPGFSNVKEIGGAFQDPGILGNSTFVRNTLEYRTYWSDQPARTGREIDAARRVLAFRAKYGVISGKVPFYEQFFMGGSDSLRGYEDDRFWGKQSALASVEYRYPIQKAFNAILFADIGTAWGGYGTAREFTQSNRPNFKIGYGVGFGFKTPLGPLRLDFGFNDRARLRTHFQIGVPF